MHNLPLNTQLIDNPAHWRLSLMIAAEGIDAVAVRTVGEAAIVTGRLPFDPGASSRAAAVEEIVYSNPMLLMPFAKVDIVVDGGFTLVVPTGTSVDDVDSVIVPDEGMITLSVGLDSRNDLIFRIDRALNNFIGRTFYSARPTHSLAVLGDYFSHRSRMGNNGKMYLDVSERSMNVLIFNQYGLAMASSFDCADTNDAAYYALASAETAGFDFSNDEIRIAGNSERRAAMMPLLRRFARHVMPAIFPAAAYNGDAAAMKAPFPLIILPLCE